MRVIGVDASRRDWVGVVLTDGHVETVALAPGLGGLLDSVGDVAVVGVDIPLGSVEGGVRRCDGEARRAIAPFGSSVFPAVPREALACVTYDAANRWCRRHCGRGLSRQSWGLRHKILDAERHWIEHPERVFEVHPEVSFRALADAHGRLTERKRTWTGHRQRLALLAAVGIEVPAELGAAGRAAADDVADAAVAAWSAQRLATAAAASIPEPPEVDEDHGHPVAIWY